MSEAVIRQYHDTAERLRSGEPLRVLIGERLYSSSEIILAAAFSASLRNDLIADIEAQIASLTPDHTDEARPSAASGELGRTSEGQN
ncbi:hypothetical protein [Mesorhizobium sp. B2-4-7]|uniref:hypothetical protein n=1 Tax=Mesorhizobium sp. B2-4-7 TaxID=2589942 RepID=UPI00112837D7|nr:hypothetical protein [Mesorhizobium sp. B2-4-7]TPL30213.1 hypothetical protein FJ946_02800 [Mesorhizobium sp. B2-4-7]